MGQDKEIACHKRKGRIDDRDIPTLCCCSPLDRRHVCISLWGGGEYLTTFLDSLMESILERVRTWILFQSRFCSHRKSPGTAGTSCNTLVIKLIINTKILILIL